MTRSFVVPSGKHKGRALDSLEDSELHAIWSGWNGSPNLKKTEFFRVIVLEVETRTGKDYSARSPVVKTRHRSMFADDGPVMEETVVYRMEFGKHKGELITLVPKNYLEWCAENLSANLRAICLAELHRRGCSVSLSSVVKAKPSASKQNRRRRSLDDSKTHYCWTDRYGFAHSIPNDVSMAGRENEECPFDAVEVQSSMNELDREFRSMFC
jgi:uncharacterized protein (DUF3820 family)